MHSPVVRDAAAVDNDYGFRLSQCRFRWHTHHQAFNGHVFRNTAISDIALGYHNDNYRSTRIIGLRGLIKLQLRDLKMPAVPTESVAC